MRRLRSGGGRRVVVVLLVAGLAACAAQSTSPRSRRVGAARFWDFYFRDRLIRLERVGENWKGLARPEAARGGVLSSLLSDAEPEPFEVTTAELRAYDYARDARFSALSVAPRPAGEAFGQVLGGTYPYRDAAPFGKQRMSELFALLRERCRLPAGSALTPDGLERCLSALLGEHSEELNQPLAALVWFLGEMRGRSSSAALLEVVRNSSHLRRGGPAVHFTAVDAAFSALWKVNDKTRLPELVELMRGADSAGRQKIARLFERLLSKDELLGLDRCGAAYLDPDFWDGVVKPNRGNTPADWDRYDAGSLFWELRWLAAVRVSPDDAETIRRLAGDMVPAVREAAAARAPRAGLTSH
ncbi:MAG: hypothetical protein ABW208_24830 [Pyrinomonadaceae bacterium]